MNMKILVHIGLSLFVKPKCTVYFDSFGVEHSRNKLIRLGQFGSKFSNV